MSEETDGGPGRLPVVDGSIYGGLAFATGYLVTLVIVVVAEGGQFFGSVTDGAGWIYYNAQFVSVEQRGFAAGEADLGGSVNYLTGEGLGELGGGFGEEEASAVQLPAAVYHAVPVLSFLGFGALLARSLGARSPVTGLRIGASLVFGGVIAALGGTYLFEVGNVMGPHRFEGVVLAGLVYPVLWGGLGGALFGLFARLRLTDPGQ